MFQVPSKSHFKLLDPEDDTMDQFSPAAIFARVRKSNVDLAASWVSQDVNKIVEEVTVGTPEPKSPEVELTPRPATPSPVSEHLEMPVDNPLLHRRKEVMKAKDAQMNQNTAEKEPEQVAQPPPCPNSPVPPLSNSQASTSSKHIEDKDQPTEQGDRLNHEADDLNIFGDDIDVYERAAASKNVNTKDYESEWRHFKSWVARNGHRWELSVQDILENRLTSHGLDFLMAQYIANRHNMTVKKREDAIVRLDPNTLRPLMSRLCAMIERNTDYR